MTWEKSPQYLDYLAQTDEIEAEEAREAAAALALANLTDVTPLGDASVADFPLSLPQADGAAQSPVPPFPLSSPWPRVTQAQDPLAEPPSGRIAHESEVDLQS